LLQNCDWLKDELDACGEDEYIILDCPGQIELYSHLMIMHNLVVHMNMWGYRMVSVYLLDALFVLEPSKFISGCMLSLSCMLQLGLPHINVVTKCDLADMNDILQVLDSENTQWMSTRLSQQTSGKLFNLTQAISSVVDDYMMVGFLPLNIFDEDSLEAVVAHTDHAVQYGEDVEPKDLVDENTDDWTHDQHM
jgi:GPN-loop GTPase